MKIALACQSVLLEKSLEIFLKSYITPYKQCNFVISDREIEIDKPLFYIATENSDLIMPFSKSALMLKVEKFYDTLNSSKEVEKTVKIDVKDIEEKITKLTDDFRKNLISTIREHYDN